MGNNGQFVIAHGGRRDNGQITGETLAFDLRTNQWGFRRPSPVPAYQGGVGMINNKMYIYGGSNLESGDLGTLQSYDMDADIWTQLPGSSAINMPGVFVHEHYLYSIYGLKNNALTTETKRFNTLTNTWENITLQNNVPPMGFIQLIKIGTDVYFVGGYKINPTYSREFYKLNVLTLTFTRLPDIPFGVYANNLFFNNGQIIVTGGWSSEPFSGNFMLEFDLETNTWSRVGDNPNGHPGSSSVQANGRSFLAGGRPGPTPDTATDKFLEFI